jgi:predicted dehydrogenase
MKQAAITRRDMLKKSAVAAFGFTIVPRYVLGGPNTTPPSEQITRAIIGVGGMGSGHIDYNYGPLLAVCDVDTNHLEKGVAKANKDGKNNCTGYHDFREVLARKDIDVIEIATPPHWHALLSIAAAASGKDVWCEKPMTRTIAEGEAVVRAIAKYKRMFRINTWFRFQSEFYGSGSSAQQFKKLVASGMLGGPLTVTVGACSGFDWKLAHWSGKTNLEPQQVPPELDYESWLGPAPFKPYHPHRVHGSFRGYWDYDAGGLGDMGQHYLDPVQYILDKDNESPVEVIPETDPQDKDAVSPWRKITIKYADGTTIILDAVSPGSAKIPYIEGPKGKVYKGWESDIPDLKKTIFNMPKIEPDAPTEFAESVKTRKKFILNELRAHRSCTMVNMASTAVRLGRPVKFDSKSQRFVNDKEANAYVEQPMRKPWHLPSKSWLFG